MLSIRLRYLLDVVAALVFATFGIGSVLVDGPETHLAVALLLVLAGSLPVAVRRRWPRTIFCVVLVAAVAGSLLGGSGVGLFAAPFALYTIASTTDRPSWEPTLSIAIATGGLGLLASVGGSTPSTDYTVVFLSTVSFGAAWSIGRAVRASRLYQDRLLRSHAERAVAEDRLRIARDLHDVIAHSLSMIAVKSGVAAHVASDQPGQAVEALRTIESTSRDTLTEVRRILGVLRSPDGSTGGPLPTLLDLPELIGQTESVVRPERAGHAEGVTPPDAKQAAKATASASEAPTAGPARGGLSVRLVLGGADEPLDVSTLPFDVQLTAYRIVQEALTNVRRHSSARECEIRLQRSNEQLEVEVLDDGGGIASDPPTAGNGLRGMRERVGMYGGSLETGNRPQGGFRVRAVIPLSRIPPARNRRTGDPSTGDPSSQDRPTEGRPPGDLSTGDSPTRNWPAGDQPIGDRSTRSRPSGGPSTGGRQTSDKRTDEGRTDVRRTDERQTGDRSTGGEPTGDPLTSAGRSS